MLVNGLYYGANQLRSSLFRAESLLLPVASWIGSGIAPQLPFKNLGEFIYVRRALESLLRKDSARLAAGLAPGSVLWSGDPVADPVSHLKRLPQIFSEAVAASRRRRENRAKEFSAPAAKLAKDSPAYYQRNFHFQRDGYLSEESAEIYDHQVELLFGGAADSMRRLVLVPLRDAWGSGTGKGKRILELGCGAGSATVQLRAAFPDAEITAVDLSAPYGKQAKARVPDIKFRQAAAEALPFGAGSFDAVVSVFLFHELPLAVRKAVIKEGKRVLKAGGLFALVDSLQLGDDAPLDNLLKKFPVEFHEPFYPNYIRNPMERLVEVAGFTLVAQDTGFFAKMVAGQKGGVGPGSPRPARRKSSVKTRKSKAKL